MKIRYFPMDGAELKPQLGLKPLEIKDWIEIDDDRPHQLSEKTRILRDHTETALRVLPAAEAGLLELYDILAAHLQSHFPHLYTDKNGAMVMEGREFSRPSNGREALWQMSHWTQEDWAVLSPAAPVVLEAGAICFPSRWSLAEKIGKGSDAIHVPVPKFDGIAKATQGFLERVVVDKPMMRLNWTIHDSDRLFCPGPHPSAPDLTESNIVERTFLRVERQTLRRLPATKAVVFSIRTYIHPLKEILADATHAPVLRDTIARLPADSAAYKGMGAFHELLKKALA